MRSSKKTPNFYYESILLKKGHSFIAGADEVGRGSFAGPVVVGCVVFPTELLIHRCISSDVHINDSKKLTKLQRERSFEWIKVNALAWAIGKGSVSEINQHGISTVTQMAFRRAVKRVNKKLKEHLKSSLDFLLLDAYYVPYIRGMRKNRSKFIKGSGKVSEHIKVLNSDYSRQLAIIKGDEKSVSIAAGSIVAKVERDILMTKLARNYKDYGWERNKGYGTKEHRGALRKHGITKHHRNQFVANYIQ